jgi:hypothetical protein
MCCRAVAGCDKAELQKFELVALKPTLISLAVADPQFPIRHGGAVFTQDSERGRRVNNGAVAGVDPEHFAQALSHEKESDSGQNKLLEADYG